MQKKANDTYIQNPEEYSGYENIKTAKVLSYIGMALAGIYLLFIILYFGLITSMVLSGGSTEGIFNKL